MMTERSTDLPRQDAAAALKLSLFDHRQTLLAYVKRHLPAVLKASVDPADIVQDVNFEALRRGEQFLEIAVASRLPWLMTIARNRILYLLRRFKASKRAVQIDQPEGDTLVVLLEELVKYERTGSASAASHELHLEVLRSMERLSANHAAAIRWHFFEGLSHGEVALKTGKSEAAVRQFYIYALGALRKELASAISLR